MDKPAPRWYDVSIRGAQCVFKEEQVVPIVVPEINQALCTGCGECLIACRAKALALVAGKAVIARPDLCEYDGGCEPVCPEGAIQLPYLIVFGDQT